MKQSAVLDVNTQVNESVGGRNSGVVAQFEIKKRVRIPNVAISDPHFTIRNMRRLCRLFSSVNALIQSGLSTGEDRMRLFRSACVSCV